MELNKIFQIITYVLKIQLFKKNSFKNINFTKVHIKYWVEQLKCYHFLYVGPWKVVTKYKVKSKLLLLNFQLLCHIDKTKHSLVNLF